MKKEKKFPTSVTILGRKVKIKQGHNLFYEGQRCLGLCDYSNKIIYIEKNQTPEEKMDTLCHEMVHYLFELCGFNQKLNDSEAEIYSQIITAFINDIKGIIT